MIPMPPIPALAPDPAKVAADTQVPVEADLVLPNGRAVEAVRPVGEKVLVAAGEEKLLPVAALLVDVNKGTRAIRRSRIFRWKSVLPTTNRNTRRRAGR